jgi:hypothetical protein
MAAQQGESARALPDLVYLSTPVFLHRRALVFVANAVTNGGCI